MIRPLAVAVKPDREATDGAVAALLARRAELAAKLDELGRRARPTRADILHLDAALAILRGKGHVPRLRTERRPAWIADLGRLVFDVPRGAAEPMTSRQVAAAVMGLAGLDADDAHALTVVEHRVRASLTRRVGIVEWVALGTHRKGWRVAPTSAGVRMEEVVQPLESSS